MKGRNRTRDEAWGRKEELEEKRKGRHQGRGCRMKQELELGVVTHKLFLGSLKQEEHQFKASLAYNSKFQASLAYMRPCLKN